MGRVSTKKPLVSAEVVAHQRDVGRCRALDAKEAYRGGTEGRPGVFSVQHRRCGGTLSTCGASG